MWTTAPLSEGIPQGISGFTAHQNICSKIQGVKKYNSYVAGHMEGVTVTTE